MYWRNNPISLILKEETYDGIIDVYENEYPHGLARLKGVMSQAALIRVDKCVYSQIPNWIGASERKVFATYL